MSSDFENIKAQKEASRETLFPPAEGKRRYRIKTKKQAAAIFLPQPVEKCEKNAVSGQPAGRYEIAYTLPQPEEKV
ncbi:MAG: hypothetical protein HFG26_00570 [Provencibacterium sp.]|nr:hypothetical protein [Provencibacterium sp.]